MSYTPTERLLREGHYLYLTTTGHKSGKAHTVELWYAYADGYVYLMAHARAHGRGTHWYQNLSHDPHVTLRVGQQTFQGQAEPLADPKSPELLTQVTEMFRRKYGEAAVHQWYEGTPRYVVRIQVRGE